MCVGVLGDGEERLNQRLLQSNVVSTLMKFSSGQTKFD